METKTFTVALEKNPVITIEVIPGHFATSNAHTNNYLDVGGLKSNSKVARNVARELAIPYLSSTLIDTIVCMEKTDVIGAYLAEELLQAGNSVINSDSEIHVLAPAYNAGGKMIFQDNVVEWIRNRNIIVLSATIASGQTIEAALECFAYYGGRVAGISTLFYSSRYKTEENVHALFSSEDIPGYKLFNIGECEMCRAGQKLDAIINSEGYTIIG